MARYTPRKRRRRNDSELFKVVARFGEVKFNVGWLSRKTHGQWEPGGKITINPVPEMVDTIIHELLHEMHPDWPEKKVRKQSSRLVAQLSDEEMLTLYREFVDRTRKCKMPYKSEAQRRWAHTPEGRAALGNVAEWDQASKGKHLPERVNRKKKQIGKAVRGKR